MVNEARPVCVYAVAGLKRNSTKLLITLCVGIALAMYGVYVQARSSSNPHYMPSISMATHWMYKHFGNKMMHPSQMIGACAAKNMAKETTSHLLVRMFIKPAIRYSSTINGIICLVQIIMLKVYCKNLAATATMGAMSVVAIIVSVLCFGGAIGMCKMQMCLSCIGIHHGYILHLIICRYRIIQNMLCPPNNTNEGACTFGSSGGVTGKIFGSGNTNQDVRRRQTGRT